MLQPVIHGRTVQMHPAVVLARRPVRPYTDSRSLRPHLLAPGITSPSPRRLRRLGWNLGLVSGTAMITDAVPPATRAKNQGMADVSIAIAGATGGFSSGLVVSASGYPVLPAIATSASSR